MAALLRELPCSRTHCKLRCQFAGQLLEAFTDRMAARRKLKLHLICRTRHIGFYTKYGFTYVQPSASHHGGRRWHEMVRDLEMS